MVPSMSVTESASSSESPSPPVPDGTSPVAPERGQHLKAQSTSMEREVGVALRNAVTVALSLLCTWSVALIVKFKLPRFLGPEHFGDLNFADNFAGTFLGFIEFGFDIYIQKEVSVRPQHASDFLGGLLLFRTAAAAALVALMLGVLRVNDRPLDVQIAVAVFAAAYLVTSFNATFGTLLQTSMRVGRFVVANVLSKVVWGLGLVVCIAARLPMAAFSVPLLVSELLRASILLPAARSALAIDLRVDVGAVRRAIAASLPYFISNAAIAVSVRLPVSILEFLVTDKREVGWLGAAWNLGTLAMILFPLMQWIVTPMLARARARSDQEVFAILRRALEGLLVVAMPVTLLIGLGAPLWVRLAFGPRYAQAALPLMAIAPQFVFTYAAMILTIGLIILDRQWKATQNALVSLALTPLLIVAIVPVAKHLGEGGAAAGAASAVVLSEVVVSVACLHQMGRGALDRRTTLAATKSLVVCLVVAVMHVALWRMGPLRLVLDLAVYVIAALGLGIVRFQDVRALVRMLRTRSARS
jgi:O-antigen/teichoic acid export membrane protein